MRLINAVFLVILILFIAVQYNDPDGAIWMLLYAVPAVWAAVAVFRPRLLADRVITSLLIFFIIAACFGVWWFWPEASGWWRQEVWWETETAREGIGMMIILIVLLFVWLTRQSLARINRLKTGIEP